MKYWMVVAAGLAASVWSVQGAGVRLVRTDGVPEALAEHARAALERNANVRAEGTASEARVEEGESLKAFGARAAGERDGLAVVLAASAENASFGALDREGGVATLNVSLLAGDGVSADTLAARVQREVLRGYGWLAGLEGCPFPLCVLTACGSPEELDTMSMNYCPPCWEKLRGLEAEKGLEVLPVAQP